MMSRLSTNMGIIILLIFSGCAGPGTIERYAPAIQALHEGPPADASGEAFIDWLYLSRTWIPSKVHQEDVNEFGIKAEIPVQHARAKILGPTRDDALRSLAAKLWLIENAQHTVDATYYIFTQDLVGEAISGALCNAVKRGVDVRIMVDSLGSMSPGHSKLKAVETCAEEAGYMITGEGEMTSRRARVQVVIFNALSKFNINRRSHDKLLVVDGFFPERAAVMTGGRNISLDYYGIREDGSEDPTAYRDLEILLRPDPGDRTDDLHVGAVSGYYYMVLFNFQGNKRIWPSAINTTDAAHWESGSAGIYQNERERIQKSLESLKNFPEIRRLMGKMPRYMSRGFRDANVRLAHELDNLTNTRVVTRVEENKSRNPNSIQFLLDRFGRDFKDSNTFRIVSPYLFVTRYVDDNQRVVHDGAKEALELLRRYPNSKIEIITNSVLTSDNFPAQAIIDMDTAPRLLLTPEMKKAWVSSLRNGELNPDIVESDEWKRLVNNPQIYIYEVGKLDSILLGHGSEHYGKLHAKFIVGEEGGFVGTSNFDYRSRLYNNEMGFFFEDPVLRRDLLEIFEMLKGISYRWGSPEWLQLRKEVMDAGGMKGSTTRKQRGIYKTLKGLGIDWQF